MRLIRVAPLLALCSAACARTTAQSSTPSSSNLPSPPSEAALAASVQSRLGALDAQSTLYAKHLASGREIGLRADDPVNTVSVIKIPVMVLAFRDAESGKLDLDQRYTIRPDDLRRGTGLLQTFATGLEPTLRDLVMQMIITSDNTATDILITRVGLERVNRLLDSLGYRQTRLRMPIGQLFRGQWEVLDPAYHSLTDREVYEKGSPSDSGARARSFRYVADSTRWFGRTTAREISRLLEQLQQGQLAGKASTDEMLRILRRQFYTSRLPQQIRFRASVGHKTGDWPPIIGNDVGIIYSDAGPIIVSVFTNQNRGSFLDLEAAEGGIAKDLLDAWGHR
ncbi:MAG: serine hydrolase [Gemmatimonadaceae bacterium]